MIWWAIERQLRDDRDAVVALVADRDAEQSPLVREVLLERVARVLAARATPADFRACARLLATAPGDAQVDRLVAGMEKGLEGRRLDAVPPELADWLDRLWHQRGPSTSLLRLALRLASPAADPVAAKRVADPQAPESDRIALVEVLGQLGRPDSLPVLLGLLNEGRAGSPSPALRLAALSALAGFRQIETAEALLARYPALSPSLRDRALSLLCGRKEWADMLLDAIARGRIAARDLRPPQVLQIVQLRDPALTARVEKVWGRVPGPGSREKRQRIAEVRGILPEGDKGRAERGRAVFQEQCAGCHRLFGEGETIGPDLTGAERGDLEYLLISLIDPSALIRKEYQAQTFALADGRVLTGLIVEESPQSITLIDSNRQRTTVPRDQVEQAEPAAVSVMPEGQLDKLRDDQIRDLFRYLQSQEPSR
jgi:putative heme-binding domain-containing protein